LTHLRNIRPGKYKRAGCCQVPTASWGQAVNRPDARRPVMEASASVEEGGGNFPEANISQRGNISRREAIRKEGPLVVQPAG